MDSPLEILAGINQSVCHQQKAAYPCTIAGVPSCQRGWIVVTHSAAPERALTDCAKVRSALKNSSNV